MKKLFTIILLAFLLFSVTACDSDDNEAIDNDVDKDITVTLNITYPNDAQKENVKNATVIIDQEDGTVLEVLEEYADDNNIPLKIENGSSPFISAINGVSGTKTSGWVYTVNDEIVMKTADQATVKDGDTISWNIEEM